MPTTRIQQVRQPGDLRAARQQTIIVATAAGLDQHRAEQLAAALSEVAANALVHGGGSATIVIDTGQHAVIIDVYDHGTGPVTADQACLPPPTQPDGRGLWLARQMCDRLQVQQSGQGTIVRLVTYL